MFPLRSERKAFQSQRFPHDGVELAVLCMSKPTLTGVVEPIRRVAVNDRDTTEGTTLLAQIKVGIDRRQSALYSCTIGRSMMVRYSCCNDVGLDAGIDIADGSGAANINAHSDRQRCRRCH